MSVHPIHAKMLPPVLTPWEVTNACVLMDGLAYTVQLLVSTTRCEYNVYAKSYCHK